MTATGHTLTLTLSPTEARHAYSRVCSADLSTLARLNLPLWVACAWDGCPPQGLAGHCDQRLSGGLSRQLQDGKLDLSRGEVTLVGAPLRLNGASLLLLGLGAPGEVTSSQGVELGRATAECIHGLGHARYGLEVVWPPEPEADRSDDARAVRTAAGFMAAHLQRRRELAGGDFTGSGGPTWILPEGMRLRVHQPSGARRRRRFRLATRRHHRPRFTTFFTRR